MLLLDQDHHNKFWQIFERRKEGRQKRKERRKAKEGKRKERGKKERIIALGKVEFIFSPSGVPL